MFRIVSKPGPPPTSCRTCRRRHQKCDMTRPYCSRCMKGGYECLGYEDSQPRVRILRNYCDLPLPETVLSGVDGVIFKAPDPLSSGLSKEWQKPFAAITKRVVGPSILGAALPYRASGRISTTDNNPSGNPSEDFDRLCPQDQSQSSICPPSSTCESVCARRSFNVTSGVSPTIKDIEGACRSIPASLDTTKMSKNRFACVAREYIFEMIGVWFMLPSPTVRNYLVNQVNGNRTERVAYLGKVILQAINSNRDPRTHDTTLKRCMGWMDEFEQNLATSLHRNAPLNDIGDCLVAHIELVLLKHALADSTSAYNLLRTALPKFLVLAAADSDLLIEQPNIGLTVSFAHVLSSPRQELVRFVMFDVIMGFLLGVAPLVDYGYDNTYECNQFESIHGIPITLFQIISQINSWRTGSRVHLDDWKTLEHRVLSWKTPCNMSEKASAPDSTTIERATVPEVWRHVLLIYIYMGVCGVSSHDSRVQSSVDRIFQLGEAMGSSRIGIHMLPHCIAAGVAARLEKHRVAVYKKLVSFAGARCWLFCGLQFSQFFYHLWHGVGAGGGAVTWDDYIQSRQAVAPVS
ncbi:unnamed protein product [Rhizoctonia solani]|uniref:Zn(2)-C6 fungal-type domain-containing protein n=1 Tax=Rhizoctonia solani TaxID=456999 RepID=A0A8H2ZYM6_9AGAM|nr:unnamed protein product [Rhizoctonia solani]